MTGVASARAINAISNTSASLVLLIGMPALVPPAATSITSGLQHYLDEDAISHDRLHGGACRQVGCRQPIPPDLGHCRPVRYTSQPDGCSQNPAFVRPGLAQKIVNPLEHLARLIFQAGSLVWGGDATQIRDVVVHHGLAENFPGVYASDHLVLPNLLASISCPAAPHPALFFLQVA